MATTQTAPNSICISKYLHSLSQTPQRLRKRMLATWTPDQELNQVRQRSGADMKRKLQWYDLVALGVGGMLALEKSGPSVFISFIIAGISALLSSLCYTEFSVQIPVAGGAFSYLRVTFGEFVGYFAGANILMEYVLSNAAVARTFTEYLSSAFGVHNSTTAWRVQVDGLVNGYDMLDFPAVALILLLTLCLCHRGLLDGAAGVYFSYIGYDSVSTMAEEIQTPSKSLPVGIVGSVLIVSVLYCLMALSLCFMVPYNKISESASFSMAFQHIGWKWAANVVGAGACLGIVASLLVAMLGQARYLCVLGRARLVPPWFAQVHPSRGTPLNATLFLGLCTATIALFTELKIVVEMINLGVLLVFYLVANALIYRKYVMISHNPPSHTFLFLFLLSSCALGFSISWQFHEQWWNLSIFGGSMIIITALFQYIVPCLRQDTEWSVPFMPWPAAMSVFLNVFLMSTLKTSAFQTFGIWACMITLFYVLYGVHSTFKAEEFEMGVNEVNPCSSILQPKVDIQVI
ncbi:hypothetical protein ACB094_10G035100 [Castanea mollissima]